MAASADGLGSLSPLSQAAAREVWRFLRLSRGAALPAPADLLLVLGSDDARVAEHAAALYHARVAPLVLLSGRVGDITRGLYGERSEAAFFADVCASRGVPREAMLLEEESTNTGENLRLSLQLLRDRGLLPAPGRPPLRVVLVQKPYMERRALAAALRQGEGVLTAAHTQVSSPDISLEDYAVATFNAALPAPTSLRRVLAVALGDLQRIAVYPARGFQRHEHIPLAAWSALRLLVATEEGLATNLVRGADGRPEALGDALPPPPPPGLALEDRVAALECQAASVQRVDLSGGRAAASLGFVALSERAARVEAAALRAGLRGCALARVPADYYGMPLRARAALLGCEPAQLCKTLVFETDGAMSGDAAAPLAAQRFVAVVLPYVTRLRADLLARHVAGGARLAAGGEALTGFGHGGVVSLGSRTPLAVVVAKQAAAQRFIWLGGGETDLKLRLFVRQLLSRGGGGVPGAAPVVLDIAEDSGGGDEDGGD